MKDISIKIFLFLLTAESLFSSGWKIPEQSANSVALSGAYVANANGAESSYYNPANMSFNSDTNQLNISFMNVFLPEINYNDSRAQVLNGNSEKESVLIPTVFYTSKDYDNLRYGISFTAPAGLTKRWKDTYPKTFSEEFTLRVMELNPVVSYKVNNTLSIAAGLRVVYSDGAVKSNGIVSDFALQRDMEGSELTYGYNLALAYKPMEAANVSVTYRSNINLKEEGTAHLYSNGIESYNGKASVEVPLPASFNIAYVHNFSKTALEFVYEKTYWSKYNNLDFQYVQPVTNPVLQTVFDNPNFKGWKNTVAKRFGITHKYNTDLTLMFGFAIDEVAAPIQTVSFELPDSDAKIYSLGYKYNLNENSNYAVGYLYSKKEDIFVVNTTLNGYLSDLTAHIISISYTKSF